MCIRDSINTRFAYVSVSRASEDVRIYTNDIAVLGERYAPSTRSENLETGLRASAYDSAIPGMSFSTCPVEETVIVYLCSNGTLRFLERPPDPLCDETCEGSCVHLNARTIQSLQILCAVFNANHRPRIPARSEQYIHQEAVSYTHLYG